MVIGDVGETGVMSYLSNADSREEGVALIREMADGMESGAEGL